VALLLAASNCNANVSFVARPTGPDRFFSNLLRRADALPAFAYRTNDYSGITLGRNAQDNKSAAGKDRASSIEALLHDAFFGKGDELELGSSTAYVGNAQATIIILFGAICLSLSPKRNDRRLAASAASEMGEILGSAVSLGVMLIGTSVSVAIRNSATSAYSADLLFYMGIMTCLVCLSMEHLLAAYQAGAKQKRALLFLLSCGMLFTACSISRQQKDGQDDNLALFRVIFSMKKSGTPIKANLVEILPVFAGFSVCFSLGFLVLLSYDMDGSSSSAIGSMCLLQVLIAGSSVLRSAVVFEMQNILVPTSFAFVLAIVVLGSTVSSRMLTLTMAHDAPRAMDANEITIIKPTLPVAPLRELQSRPKRVVRFKDDDHLVEYFEDRAY
jgi:hypothetical protein